MTLTLYIMRRFLWNLFRVQLALLFLIILIDSVEMARILDIEEGIFAAALELALLHAPVIAMQVVPLVVLLASIATFLGLSRSSELVIGRAAGMSALRLIAPVMIMTFLIGALLTMAFNPVVSATMRRWQVLKDEYATGGPNQFSLGSNSIWLRQGTENSQIVIQAARASADGARLFAVRFHEFDLDGNVINRIEASRAELENGYWLLSNVKRWRFLENLQEGESDISELVQLRVTTSLTSEEILDSFSEPRTVAIWDLPHFIDRLEVSGFSARRHRVFFQAELARPILLVAMLLIGIGFSIRHSRFGQTGIMVLTAVMCGFIVFAVKSLSESMGSAQEIPTLAAAWGPPLAFMLLPLALILHLEDG